MDPFIGEIRTFPINYAPYGWAFCDGSSLAVNQNQALFSLIGVYYGGNNVNFNLPDLRGRAAVNFGNPGVQVGTKSGTETVALTATQVPQHTHTVNVVNANGKNSGAKAHHISAAVIPGTSPQPTSLYSTVASNLIALNPATVGTTGGGASHTNVQPYLVLGYFIATIGTYPMRP
jgi:microcystin-dependent protein